jgi:hypothetical protein
MLSNLEPDEFIKKASKIEASKRKRTLVLLLTLTILAIGYITYTSLKIKKSEDEKENVISEFNNLKVEGILIDSAKKVILNYFDYQNKKDTLGIISLLADTVLRYYLSPNVPISKELLTKNEPFEINQNGTYLIDSNSFGIVIKDDTLLANVISPSYDGKNTWSIIHEFKLNLSNKILYIRAYDLNSEYVQKKFNITPSK